MVKGVLYGYMKNMYWCGKIEKWVVGEIDLIWVGGYEKGD